MEERRTFQPCPSRNLNGQETLEGFLLLPTRIVIIPAFLVVQKDKFAGGLPIKKGKCEEMREMRGNAEGTLSWRDAEEIGRTWAVDEHARIQGFDESWPIRRGIDCLA